MYPVVVICEEVKMEVVQTYNTAYAGFPGEHRDILIEYRKVVRLSTSCAVAEKSDEGREVDIDDDNQRAAQKLPVDLTTQEPDESWTPGRVELETALKLVKGFESTLTDDQTFLKRRELLKSFLNHLSHRGYDHIALETVEVVFLARNPSEIPHRHKNEKLRALHWKTVVHSGTENKVGRNFRQPGEMAFSTQARQKHLFRNWTWPVETMTAVDELFDIGPHDELIPVTAAPPKGDTWNTLLATQKEAVQNPWIEQWPSGQIGFGNPLPGVKRAVISVKQKALDAKRSVDWT